MAKLPLKGIRVVDLTTFWAGPVATSYLGWMGAEVIKVEGVSNPDHFRYGPVSGFDLWWEAFSSWISVNINKCDLTLELTTPKGKELFLKLVTKADVVIDNFSTRVIENFGLTYPVLKEVKPDVIQVRLPGYGTTGPWRDYAAFGLALEQSQGLAWVTGYPDSGPLLIGGASDQIGGINAALAIQLALQYRRRTGKGQFIDISQMEAGTQFMGQALMDYGMNRRVWGREGNRDPAMAPHGVYRCKGENKFVAIAVSSDDEWKEFCRAIGSPEWCREDRFVSLVDRWKNQNELNQLIESWTICHENTEVMDTMQKTGVAAGVVNEGHEYNLDPHVKARGYFFVDLPHPVIGTQPYSMFPIKMSKTATKPSPCPTLGQHNEHILTTLLGLSKAEIKQLKDQNVIGTRPLAFKDTQSK